MPRMKPFISEFISGLALVNRGVLKGRYTGGHGLTIKRCLGHTAASEFNQPPSADDLPRPAGISSMFRLPIYNTTKGLDVCFVGVPFDQGASNRSGTRFGPRQIRQESTLVRVFNKETGASPYESLRVGDVSDVYITMYDIARAVQDIERQYKEIVGTGCKPLTLGGDHTITYPILRAIKDKHGPVGLIHVDAHCDVNEHMNNCAVAHGTTFRRALEDGCLDPRRVVQIGLRGSGYSLEDYEWPISQGFRVIPARECYHKSLTPLMDEVRKQIESGPVYISFDIDALDPSFAPGTGTPEIGGLTSIQGLEILRGCRGLNVIGGDVVEVSPPYDPSGNTALTAANLLFEMLCILPGVRYKKLPI